MSRAQLITADAIRTFALAGNARLTLVSVKSGARFTYRVRQPEAKGADGAEAFGLPTERPASPHFVSLLSGPDNDADYAFLGTIFADGGYRHGRKSKIGSDAPSARAWAWFHERVLVGGALPPGLEVWHEGRCGRCGRALTVPESIASGIGPVCEEAGL